MIRADSINILIDLFNTMANKEEVVERERQNLASLKTFDPLAVFQSIDTDRDGLVDSRDICSFMSSLGFNRCTDKDFDFVINYFDSSNSRKLNYNDFMQILLPCTNDFLRNEALNRKPQMYGLPKSGFSPEVTDSLCALLEKEVDYHRETEEIKIGLASSPDFNPEALFNEIDYQRFGFLDFNSIQNLLKNFGVKASETEINSIIRRLDVTANAQISLSEFIDGTKCETPKFGLYSQEPRIQCSNSLRNKAAPTCEYPVNKYADVGYSYKNAIPQSADRYSRAYTNYEEAARSHSHYYKDYSSIEQREERNSDTKMPFSRDHECYNKHGDTERKYQDINDRGLPQNYSIQQLIMDKYIIRIFGVKS